MLRKLSLSLVVLLAFPLTAAAQLSTEASAAVTAISGAITDMEAAVWVPIAAVTLAIVGFKLFKRFSNRI